MAKKKQTVITMKVPWIDEQILKQRIITYKYDVTYKLFNADSLPEKIPFDINKKYNVTLDYKHKVCFAGLTSDLSNKDKSKRLNKLYVEIPLNEEQTNILSHFLLKLWIKACKKYLGLPDYIPSNLFRRVRNKTDIENSIVKKARCIFDLTEDMTPAQLYMYLSCIRYPREHPEFVATTLYLTEVCKMNFYIAFVCASMLCINASGHHIISSTQPYIYKPGLLETPRIPISTVVSLAAFARDPQKYDKRSIYNSTSFSCSETIRHIFNYTYGDEINMSIYDAYAPLILQAMEELDLTKTKQIINEFMDQKKKADKIIYEVNSKNGKTFKCFSAGK